MKPSEENSIVPKFIRDKVREMKQRKREEEIGRERRNTPPQKPSSKEDSEALKELIESDKAPSGANEVQYGRKGGGGGTTLVREGVSAEDIEKMYRKEKDQEKAMALAKAAGDKSAFEIMDRIDRQYPGGTNPAVYPGAPEDYPKKFAKGGLVKKKMGGMVKKASKGRSHRGDGVCQKGFTKGRMY